MSHLVGSIGSTVANKKRLTIMLLTYKRLAYAKITLRSTLENIKFSGEIAVHIADDGSGGDHIDTLYSIAGDYYPVSITATDSKRGGYGANYNLATQAIHDLSDYVLPLEDDWELDKSLDVDPLVRALESSVGIECIRLGYLSFTQGLYGRVMSAPPEWYKYLLLDPSSPEPFLWCGHPRIETVSYEKRVGAWPEGISPGDTEFAVTHYPESRIGVAWPLDLGSTFGIFKHIGAIRSTEILNEDVRLAHA